MGTDVLLLAMLASLTIIGYMIAINSHGPTRLSISYLLATILLAGTVWAIVQYVNSGLDRQKMEQLQRLEIEKQKAEQRVASQEEALRQNKERAAIAGKFNSLINTGTGLATTMINVDLHDISFELDALIARANEIRKQSNELKNEFEKIQSPAGFFPEAIVLMKEALADLTEASQYFVLYYRSDDSTQEGVRERVLRQKARAAYEKFQKAIAVVGSAG